MLILPTNHLLYTLTVDVRYFCGLWIWNLGYPCHSKRYIVAFDRNVMRQITHCQLFFNVSWLYGYCFYLTIIAMQRVTHCQLFQFTLVVWIPFLPSNHHLTSSLASWLSSFITERRCQLCPPIHPPSTFFCWQSNIIVQPLNSSPWICAPFKELSPKVDMLCD